MRPDKILEEAAALFRQRNALYGDTHEQVGRVLHALGFATGERDANRLFLITQIANKLTRYAALAGRGGHKDSARDMIVYAAMLEEITDEEDTVLAPGSDATGT